MPDSFMAIRPQSRVEVTGQIGEMGGENLPIAAPDRSIRYRQEVEFDGIDIDDVKDSWLLSVDFEDTTDSVLIELVLSGSPSSMSMCIKVRVAHPPGICVRLFSKFEEPNCSTMNRDAEESHEHPACDSHPSFMGWHGCRRFSLLAWDHWQLDGL